MVKPFGGITQQGPNDSGVLWLHPHGGAQDNTISVGCGLAPRLSLYDPYIMAQMAVDEAVRNIVSTGADIDQACALDNFCWPNPIWRQHGWGLETGAVGPMLWFWFATGVR